jgi:phage tail-like protein
MAGPGEDKPIYPVQHFRLDLGGYESGGLYYQATAPAVTITAPDWKAENEQKKPQNYHAGVQVSHQPITLSRGIDDNTDLAQWVQDIKEKGVTADTKKGIKLILVDSQGEDELTWNITGAYPTNYQPSGVNAQTGEIAVETVTLNYDDATRE